IWWIEYAGLGGIRMDTWPYPEPGMMNKWSCRIEEEYPNFSIVGEEWSMNPAVIASWQKGTPFAKGQNSCLKNLFDFPTQESLVKALTQDETWGTGWVTLYESFSNDFLYPSPYELVVFPDNHDMNRFYKQVNQDVDLFRMGLAFILTTRGIPQIYYGTEIQMNNPKTDKHEEIRSDFPGGWPDDKINAFTNEGLSKEKIETKEYVKTLLNYRKTSGLIHHGKLMHFAPENGVYVFFRYNDSEALMIVLNKNKTNTKLKTDRFEERLTGYTKGVNITSKEEVELSSPLSLPPLKATILELKR
ncbi:MAG: cyclomaltodextrinase C-terminal domain-containing protein, partial [Bacteroidales bacterium]|nr:cyclomaltodextrinase C-terminal domain-containing protein [Bacteroidales bacterium]